jgi:hypothetical protein
LQVRRNDEVAAQSRSERDRWTFYETINIPPPCKRGVGGIFPKAGQDKSPSVPLKV